MVRGGSTLSTIHYASCYSNVERSVMPGAGDVMGGEGGGLVPEGGVVPGAGVGGGGGREPADKLCRGQRLCVPVTCLLFLLLLLD